VKKCGICLMFTSVSVIKWSPHHSFLFHDSSAKQLLHHILTVLFVEPNWRGSMAVLTLISLFALFIHSTVPDDERWYMYMFMLSTMVHLTAGYCDLSERVLRYLMSLVFMFLKCSIFCAQVVQNSGNDTST